MVLPKAFTVPDGQAHSETFVKVRPIEYFYYFIAANQIDPWAKDANGLPTYRHSTSVAPEEKVISHRVQQQGIRLTKIDVARMSPWRKKFPVLKHYRLFLIQELANELRNIE